MNRDLLNQLIHWPRAYLTRTEIGVLLDRTPDACDAIVRRAIEAGYLKRIRRGLYLITPKAGASRPDSLELAQLVYGPSYISFESALSWHGWIPEGVRLVMSATSKRSKSVVTPITTFSYQHIPKTAFCLGVRQVQTSTGACLMADAWKALADLVYVRKKNWPGVTHLEEDLRVEPDDLVESNLDLLAYLARAYPNGRTRHFLSTYYQELSR